MTSDFKTMKISKKPEGFFVGSEGKSHSEEGREKIKYLETQKRSHHLQFTTILPVSISLK